MKKIYIFFLIIFSLLILTLAYFKFINKEVLIKTNTENTDKIFYSSNVIDDVSYSSKDAKGNIYTIKAINGEIDYKQSNIIYLKKVKAVVELINSNNIKITSNYGKYDTESFDTIFSKNVEVDYLDNNILGEYLDFSLKRNSMIISRNVIYSNSENILKADVIDININTKDTKIFMYENNNKVNIKNIN